MALPTTRNDFKELCLRQLGKPVINIDVANTQVDDCVDLALSYYADYHFDGSQKQYYRYQITQTDKDNKYITLPENIIGAIRLFDIGWGSYGVGQDMFNIQYQIALNDLYTLTSTSMIPYYMTMTHLELLSQLLVGQQPISYNRHTNRLHVHMNWDKVVVGQYVIVEAYGIIDPEEYEDVWKDRWLIEYCTQLIKQQWGNNLKKFGSMQLTSGVVFNGQQIYDEAQAKLEQMRAEMLNSYSLPATDMIG